MEKTRFEELNEIIKNDEVEFRQRAVDYGRVSNQIT